MAVNYKGGCCQRCGYSSCMEALEFHHKDPSKKDFSISSKGYTRSWSKVQNELDRCVMLCANCHREVHAQLAALGGNTKMQTSIRKLIASEAEGKSGLIQGNPGQSHEAVSKGNPELALSIEALIECECRDFTPAILT